MKDESKSKIGATIIFNVLKWLLKLACFILVVWAFVFTSILAASIILWLAGSGGAFEFFTDLRALRAVAVFSPVLCAFVGLVAVDSNYRWTGVGGEDIPAWMNIYGVWEKD